MNHSKFIGIFPADVLDVFVIKWNSVDRCCIQVYIEDKAKTLTNSSTQLHVSAVGSRVSVTRASGAVESVFAEADQKRAIRRLSSPFVRQDIFYPGSITSLKEYKTSQDMATYVQVSSMQVSF